MGSLSKKENLENIFSVKAHLTLNSDGLAASNFKPSSPFICPFLYSGLTEIGLIILQKPLLTENINFMLVSSTN